MGGARKIVWLPPPQAFMAVDSRNVQYAGYDPLTELYLIQHISDVHSILVLN